MIKDSEWGSSKRPTISQEQHAPLPQAWFEELSGMGGGGSDSLRARCVQASSGLGIGK